MSTTISSFGVDFTRWRLRHVSAPLELFVSGGGTQSQEPEEDNNDGTPHDCYGRTHFATINKDTITPREGSDFLRLRHRTFPQGKQNRSASLARCGVIHDSAKTTDELTEEIKNSTIQLEGWTRTEGHKSPDLSFLL